MMVPGCNLLVNDSKTSVRPVTVTQAERMRDSKVKVWRKRACESASSNNGTWMDMRRAVYFVIKESLEVAPA